MNDTNHTLTVNRGDAATTDAGVRRRRTAIVGLAVSALGLTALVAWAAVVLVPRDGETGTSVSPSEPHTGMVAGTVWVANEAGNSLTAIDAATHEVVTTVGASKARTTCRSRRMVAASGRSADTTRSR